MIATCMCSAPIGSIPSLIDVDELGIGIDFDDSGIGDELWAAAAEGCPEEHAAATSASAPAPTAARKTEPGRQRPRDEDLDMDRPPQVPSLVTGTVTDDFEDASKDAPAAALIAPRPASAMARSWRSRPGKRTGQATRAAAVAPCRRRPPGKAARVCR